MSSPDTAVILLIEDLEDDILLVRKALQRAKLPNPLYVVRDGEEAITYLMGDPPFSNRSDYPLPDLVLLDLKMPKVDGFETLRWVRTQPGIRSVPVIVLTSSEDLREVNQAYTLGANSFLVKPLDFDNSEQLARAIHHFWQKSTKLPETLRSAPGPAPS